MGMEHEGFGTSMHFVPQIAVPFQISFPLSPSYPYPPSLSLAPSEQISLFIVFALIVPMACCKKYDICRVTTIQIQADGKLVSYHGQIRIISQGLGYSFARL